MSRPYTFLLIDADPANAFATMKSLRKAGVKENIIIFKTMEEAVYSIQQKPGPVVFMVDFNGMESDNAPLISHQLQQEVLGLLENFPLQKFRNKLRDAILLESDVIHEHFDTTELRCLFSFLDRACEEGKVK